MWTYRLTKHLQIRMYGEQCLLEIQLGYKWKTNHILQFVCHFPEMKRLFRYHTGPKMLFGV